MLHKNQFYFMSIVTVSLGLILSVIINPAAQAFAQTANNTAVSTTTKNVQPFVFVYKVSGGFPGLDQRTFYDSLTKDLVWIDEHPITGNLNSMKVIPLNSTTENNLKKTMRDGYLFGTKGAYYTRILDLPVEKLYVLLDGKLHTVQVNLPWKPGVSEVPVPEGLRDIIHAIQNITTSK